MKLYAFEFEDEAMYEVFTRFLYRMGIEYYTVHKNTLIGKNHIVKFRTTEVIYENLDFIFMDEK